MIAYMNEFTLAGAFKCYTTMEGCTGDFQMENNRRDCCLGGGLFYELEGVENCTQCVGKNEH